MIDYKHIRTQSQKPQKKWGRKVLALLMLLLIGATPLAYSYYKNGTLLIKDASVKAQPKVEPVTEVNIPDRFTYFEILAKGEAVIPDKDILKLDVPSNRIYLQLAAFKTAAEADNFQAQIKLLDLSPKIETLFLPNKGGNWFTVRLGAIETDAELARLKLALDSNHIQFAVVTKE
jgi:cell division protein FtsN